jgi:hypothetical protein
MINPFLGPWGPCGTISEKKQLPELQAPVNGIDIIGPQSSLVQY